MVSNAVESAFLTLLVLLIKPHHTVIIRGKNIPERVKRIINWVRQFDIEFLIREYLENTTREGMTYPSNDTTPCAFLYTTMVPGFTLCSFVFHPDGIPWLCIPNHKTRHH